MKQAPFEDPIASQPGNFLAVFNANRNVIPRTVECLCPTTLYPEPDEPNVRHLTLFIEDQYRSCAGCTNDCSDIWIKCTKFFIFSYPP